MTIKELYDSIEKDDALVKALEETVRINGKAIIRDGERVYAMLTDLLPGIQYDTERRRVKIAYECGAVQTLISSYAGGIGTDACIEAGAQRMVSGMDISGKVAVLTMIKFAMALGMKFPDKAESRSEEPADNNAPAQPHADKKTKQSDDDKVPAQQEQYVEIHDFTKSQSDDDKAPAQPDNTVTDSADDSYRVFVNDPGYDSADDDIDRTMADLDAQRSSNNRGLLAGITAIIAVFAGIIILSLSSGMVFGDNGSIGIADTAAPQSEITTAEPVTEQTTAQTTTVQTTTAQTTTVQTTTAQTTTVQTTTAQTTTVQETETAPEEKIPEANKDFVIGDMRLIKYTGNDDDVVIPYGVRVIGEAAFANSLVKSVTFPVSCTMISDNAFESCTRLEKVTLPQTTVLFGVNAFLNCSNLKELEFVWGSPEDSDSSAFRNGDLLGSYMFAEYAGGIIKNSAFKGCSSLEKIEFDFTETIESQAFSGCTSLEYIAVPDTLETIEKNAFVNCNDELRLIYKGTSDDWYNNVTYDAEDLKNTVELYSTSLTEDNTYSFVKEGYHVVKYDNGKYEGYYRNDVCYGMGKYTWDNGDIYEGEWKDDLPDGKGKLTKADGSYYDGEWAEFKKSGHFKWVSYYDDGDWEEGEGDYWNDELNGEYKCTVHYAGGARDEIEGFCSDGELSFATITKYDSKGEIIETIPYYSLE